MTSQSVELISNYYRVHSDDDLAKKLHQYDIEVLLSKANLSGDFDQQTLFLFINQMKDQRRIPLEWRRRIVSAAVDQWLAAEKPELEDRFVKCDLDCHKLIANIDLHAIKEDTKLLNVPYRHGNLRLSTLRFSVRLKRAEFDHLTLLNIAIGVDGCTSPTLAEQSSTSTTQYNTNCPIPSFGHTLLLRGQTLQMKSLASGPAFSICYTPGRFFRSLGKSQGLIDYVCSNFDVVFHGDKSVPPSIWTLNKKLVGRRVEVSHIELFNLPRRVQICGISVNAPEHIATVREHFEKHYGIELDYPDWPCVVCNSNQEQLKIPMELCRLVGPEKSRNQHVELPAINPLDYFRRVERYAKYVVNTNRSNLRKIGLSVVSKSIEVTGQVLDSVSLIGRNQSGEVINLKSDNGQFDASTARFVRPIKLNKFSLTLIGSTKDSMRQYDVLKEFIEEYCRVGKSQGVEIDSYTTSIDIIIHKHEGPLKEMLRKHVEHLNEQSYDHSIMVGSDSCKYICSYLHFLETQFDRSTGLRTRLSCLPLSSLKQRLDEAKNKDDTLMRDLWLRYNFQLGGMNYVLDSHANQLLGDNFLVLGVDVRDLDRNGEFMVTAVVGLWSMNSERFSHSTQLQAQPARFGNVGSSQPTNVGLMIGRILVSYYTKMNKCLPSEILILLNDSSNEKLCMGGTSGLGEIIQVFGGIYAKIGKKEPNISCLHIQQRHDVRLELSSPINVDGEDDYQLPSGTIITDSNLLGQDTFALYSAPRFDLSGDVAPLIARKLRGEIATEDNNYYHKLLHALCYLLPSTMCTNLPAPIDLAERASRRGRAIASVWKRECSAGDDWIDQLDAYYSSLGTAYLDTPFYV